MGWAVTALDAPDIRGEPNYRINFQVKDENNAMIDGMTHRIYAEFKTLDEKLDRTMLPAGGSDLILPSEADATIENLNAYLQVVSSSVELLDTHLVQDFMGINWSGADVRFLTSMDDFFDMMFVQRLPEFMPEPPVIDEDDFLAPETPFEVYVYFLAFRHDKKFTAEYLDFFKAYTTQTPSFDGPEDGSDVLYPGAQPLDYPYFYNRTYVHFLPGGYLNGQTSRVSYLGKTKFSFLNESLIAEWILQLHGDKSPKTILDLGTGNCFSAFVLGELYPEATVIGVDMAAPYIRFCRKWKEIRGADNVEFYQANGEDLSIFADETFDFVNYAYVLHEMPGENAKRVVDEMVRILSPGGTLNGFEVPYFEDPAMATFYSLVNTWGFNWDADGDHGPEPYTHEYEFNARLPEYLNEIGLSEVEVIFYTYFESIFLAKKPM